MIGRRLFPILESGIYQSKGIYSRRNKRSLSIQIRLTGEVADFKEKSTSSINLYRNTSENILDRIL
jgi:hypothetical protein